MHPVSQPTTQQTGLSRAALLSRLTRELPSAIDRYRIGLEARRPRRARMSR
jgi:hypothetical protein